jgi:hypothetical protein
VGAAAAAATSAHFDGTVIVAVAPVRVMQMAIDDVVGVIAVGDRVVAAVSAVLMSVVVLTAVVRRRARGRVRAADGEGVLVDVIAVDVMKMAVVKEVMMAIVLDRLVAAARAVGVGVLVVRLVFGAHGLGPSTG